MAQVLRTVAPAAVSPDLLAGPEGYDDVGAIRLHNGKVGLHTVDFFPPVVDDAWAYGAIAAANSLSDIYASGGEAKVVLNLAGFPSEWGDEILQPIFEAAVEKVQEAEALWVGGHSVVSTEPLYGFAIYGEVAEEDLATNNGARAGDLVFLTKPVGNGSINTGVKRGVANDADVAAAVEGMARLNRKAAAAMRSVQAKAATDITGFGLFGHAANLARASEITMHLSASALPLYPGAAALAQEGVFSGASKRGRKNLTDFVTLGDGVPDWLASLGFDAETSGGLLVCVPPEKAQDFLSAIPADEPVAQVGEIREGQAGVVVGE